MKIRPNWVCNEHIDRHRFPTTARHDTFEYVVTIGLLLHREVTVAVILLTCMAPNTLHTSSTYQRRHFRLAAARYRQSIFVNFKHIKYRLYQKRVVYRYANKKTANNIVVMLFGINFDLIYALTGQLSLENSKYWDVFVRTAGAVLIDIERLSHFAI